MRPVLAFILIVIVLLIVFFLQNTEPVGVEFLFLDIKISLALVIVISLLVGVVLGIMVLQAIKPKAESYKIEENAKRHAEETAK